MTTTTAVPSSDVSDFVYNVQKLDEITTGSALTYLDRLGVERSTAAGAMARFSALNPRGAWATATVYQPRDLVLESGTWYIALNTHTSGATFAGDLTAHWRPEQGVTAADLSSLASSLLGSYLVGVDFAGSNLRELLYTCFGRTANEIAAGITPTNYAYAECDIRRYGAIDDASTDARAATVAALTVGTGRTAYVPATKNGFNYLSGFTIPADTTLHLATRWKTKLMHSFNGDFITMGDGAAIVNGWLDGRAASGFTGKALSFTGTDGRQCVHHCRITDWDGACLDIAVAAASQSSFFDLRIYRSAAGTGTNRFAVVISPTQQLSAVPRKFSHIETDGTCSFDFGGCNDTLVSNSFLGDLKFTADSRGVNITTTRIANQAALTVDGHGVTIVACDIAPQITIASGADGIVIGPSAYNNLPVIDNSGNGLNMVYHWWNSYTPTLTSGGVAPVLGNGTLSAKWCRQGNETTATINFTVGTTTTLGTGDLRFSIPSPCTFSLVQEAGRAVGVIGGVNYVGIVQLAASGTFVTMLRDTSGPFTFNSPGAWAAGDTIRLTFTYQA